MQSISKKFSIRRELSPLKKENRIEALISAYTSDESACPFYVCDNPSVRSKCHLDPHTWRVWDCKGICFSQGLCCEYLLDALENKVIKYAGER